MAGCAESQGKRLLLSASDEAGTENQLRRFWIWHTRSCIVLAFFRHARDHRNKNNRLEGEIHFIGTTRRARGLFTRQLVLLDGVGFDRGQGRRMISSIQEYQHITLVVLIGVPNRFVSPRDHRSRVV